jgi:hypothetical protein
MNSTTTVPQSPINLSDIKDQLAYDLWAKFNPVQIGHLLDAVKSLQPGDDLVAFLATLKRFFIHTPNLHR